MSKISRTRKKWLKKHNKYVNPKDTWNLDYTIAEFVLPRLKEFKKVTIAYPGCGDADTPEKWDEILDKMIIAFELVLIDNLNDRYWYDDHTYNRELYQEDQKKIQEGLYLFAKWYSSLWW